MKKSKIKVPAKTKLTQDQGKPYLKSKKYAPVYNNLNKIDDNADKIKGGFLEIKSASLTSSGKAKLSWEKIYLPSSKLAKITYQVQMADNPDFKNATTYKTTKTSLSIAKSKLGTNGGKFYFRLRAYDSASGEKVYSDWSATAEYSFVKINATNFPGLHMVLKNGIVKYDAEGNKSTTVFDTNKDGWLDPAEISEINEIVILQGSFPGENGWVYVDSEAVSSLEGLEYLSYVSTVDVDNFTGTQVDLTDTNVDRLSIGNYAGASLQIIAPRTDEIEVDVDYENAYLTSLDLSECNWAKSIWVNGCSETRLLKLPKCKWRLKTLRLNNLTINEADLNVYSNLKNLGA